MREALEAVVGAAHDSPVGDDADDLDTRQRLADGDRDLEGSLAVGSNGGGEVEDVRQGGEGESSL